MRSIINLFAMFVSILSCHVGFSREIGFMHGMTEEHNKVRQEVGLPEVVWSDELAQYAQQWADHLAMEKGCRLLHRPRSGEFAQQYGENIYWASAFMWSDGARELKQIAAAQVVQNWADEAANYSYATNSCRPGKKCGHYTQLIWKLTEKIGCGRSVCGDKSQIWVCNYDPPGNLQGQSPY